MVTISRDNCTDCTLSYYFNLDWFPIAPPNQQQYRTAAITWVCLFLATNACHMTGEALCFVLFHKAAKPLNALMIYDMQNALCSFISSVKCWLSIKVNVYFCIINAAHECIYLHLLWYLPTHAHPSVVRDYSATRRRTKVCVKKPPYASLGAALKYDYISTYYCYLCLGRLARVYKNGFFCRQQLWNTKHGWENSRWPALGRNFTSQSVRFITSWWTSFWLCYNTF